jgi:hypothetical protein
LKGKSLNCFVFLLKCLGKFRDETSNLVIRKFVALKPKMYAMEVYDPALAKGCRECKASGTKCFCMWSEVKKAKV